VSAVPEQPAPHSEASPHVNNLYGQNNYLAELLAGDCSPLTLRSSAFDLLDWFRFLAAASLYWQPLNGRTPRCAEGTRRGVGWPHPRPAIRD
jgi:hypothetical protein